MLNIIEYKQSQWSMALMKIEMFSDNDSPKYHTQ